MNALTRVTNIAVAKPLNSTIEMAGPDAIPLDEAVRQFLKANRDPRTATPD